MSAIAIQPAIASPGSHVAASASPGGEPDTAFAALLGQFADVFSEKRDAKTEIGETKDAANSPSGGPSQSLEAALTALAHYAHSLRATASTGDAPTETAAQSAASALDAAVGALGSGAWDLSGKTPLKAQLANDPSLGMSDFQIRTFLAAAGATPARAGAATLGANSAWSPLDAVKLAGSVVAATPVRDPPAPGRVAAPELRAESTPVVRTSEPQPQTAPAARTANAQLAGARDFNSFGAASGGADRSSPACLPACGGASLCAVRAAASGTVRRTRSRRRPENFATKRRKRLPVEGAR